MRWSAVAAGLVGLMLAVPTHAMTIVRVADEELVAEAPLVVVARVLERGPAASGAPSTDYRFAVEEVLKGAVGPELTVQVPGGMGADGIGRRIYGAPSFAPGERTILFLTPGRAGDHRLLHLVQGAFHERRHEGRSLALRDMSEVTEMRLDGGALEAGPAAATEEVRDFDAFARWIGATARGRSAGDYRVELPAARAGAGRIAAPFSLFMDGGLKIRWFEFDTGDSVPWHYGTGGQPGVPGGGQSQFQTALQAWNADSQTPIRYTFAGISGQTGGLCTVADCGFNGYDVFNVLLLGDPNDELTNLNAFCTGTLAYGGPWFQGTQSFRGEVYHVIQNADIVINDGLECFFNGSQNAAAAVAELYAHELGHTLGIDHSTHGEALMFPNIHNDGRGAKLESDDLAAARALYRQANNPPPPPPLTAPAAPTALTAAANSTSEIELAWQDNSNDETGFIVEAKQLGGTFVAIGTLPANSTGAIVEQLAPATGYVFQVRATNAQGPSAPTNEAQASTDALPGACFPGAQTLCLAGGRFQVDVDWAATNQSTSGQGQVVPGVASDDSGLFYFFNPANWELVVKVLNACPVNDRFWVFAGGLTNVQVELRVVDTSTGKVEHYFNPPNTAFQPVQDTGAFATCP